MPTLGQAADVAISTVGGAFGLGGAVIGGAAGGAIGTWIDGGSWTDAGTAAWQGAAGGLLGGALGAGAAWGARAGIASKVRKLDNEIKVADKGINKLQKKLNDRNSALKKAENSHNGLFVQKNPNLGRRAMNALSGRPNIPKKVPGPKVSDAQIKKSKKAVKQAEGERDSAAKRLKKEEREKKKINDLSDEWKKKQDWFKGGYSKYTFTGGWGSRGLMALGSLAVAVGRNIGTASRDDDSGLGAGVADVDGIWVGGLVEVMNEGPFRPGTTDPSQTREGEPPGFLFEPKELDNVLHEWYAGGGGAPGSGSLAEALSDNWQLFGDSENFATEAAAVTPLPIVPTSLSASGESPTPDEYPAAAARLATAAQRFEALQQAVAEQVVEAAENTELGREQIEHLIAGINTYARGTVADNVNASFAGLLEQAFNENVQTMEQRSGTSSDIAGMIADLEQRMNEQLETDRAAMQEGLEQARQNQFTPSYPGVPSVPTPNVPTPEIPEAPNLPGTPGDPSRPELPAPGTPDVPGRPDTPDVPGSPNTPGTPDDPSRPPVTAPGATPDMGMGGMGALSSLLPLLAMQGGGLGQNRFGREDLDPRRYDRERLSPARPAPVQPVPAPSGQQAPSTGTPAGQPPQPSAMPPASATAPQDAGAPPTHRPAADGKVMYTFPDGRTQEVYPKVADALDAAFAETGETDARAAYGMASAKSGASQSKYPGDRVDPQQLMTGDIAMWADRTALLAVFGSPENGTLEVVVDGTLRQFEPEMRDSAGEFGAFAGFFHPVGVAASGTGDTTVPTDPTAQPIPALAMPA